jgi:hypothetical protein
MRDQHRYKASSALGSRPARHRRHWRGRRSRAACCRAGDEERLAPARGSGRDPPAPHRESAAARDPLRRAQARRGNWTGLPRPCPDAYPLQRRDQSRALPSRRVMLHADQRYYAPPGLPLPSRRPHHRLVHLVFARRRPGRRASPVPAHTMRACHPPYPRGTRQADPGTGPAQPAALSATDRDLLPGTPVPTRTGLSPAGMDQLPGRNVPAAYALARGDRWLIWLRSPCRLWATCSVSLLTVAWPPGLASYGCLGSGPDPRPSGSSGGGLIRRKPPGTARCCKSAGWLPGTGAR